MITEVLPSAAAVLGVDACTDTLALTDRLGPVRRIAVLLVDGLGYHLLPRSPRMMSAVDTGVLTELACTLPSTTPTSLVSFGTGLPPGQHGVLGFRVNLPGTDDVVTHIVWRADPPPATWAPAPTVFARMPSATVVLPATFAGSGLTEAAYGGARFVGVHRDDDPVDLLLRELRERPGLVFGYHSEVDTAAHSHGIASPQWHAACDRAADVIERIVAGLPADAALLVTADHGGLDVPPTSRLEIGDDPRLRAGLRVVAGEPRLRYLHTDPGAHEDVLAAWTEILGTRADVLARADAVAAGLSGPVREEFLERIGDVVVVCRDDFAVFATGWESEDMRTLVGMHGAREPVETAIPLLSYSSLV